MTGTIGGVSADEPAYAGRAGVAGWLLFDAAVQPWFTLVTTFVYAPYFATAIAATPAEGQSLWGLATGIAGFVIAIASPVLGAIADASGRRKPWIAVFTIMTILAALVLWYGQPGAPDMIVPVLIAFAIGTVGAEFATVFTNAMMPSLVPPHRIGRLSGSGWAIGYVGGLISLVIVLGFIAGSPDSGLTLFGLEPLFGLDPALREGDRFSGPFSALWLAILIVPLMLFTPDGKQRVALGAAVRAGLADLKHTIGTLGEHRPVFLFLVARMAYTDGLVALFAFGGIYAAGIFGWQTIEIGIFGIWLTITGTIGALAGGRLDDRFGPKAVIGGALWVLMAGAVGVLSVDASHVLFVVPVAPAGEGGLFSSPGEVFYLVFGGLIGLAAGPIQAASRTLLIVLAPKTHITQFFGLFAFSGKVTSFLGPLVVAGVTAVTADQRIGIASILAFLVVGAGLLTLVQAEGEA
ncbi:MAG: MFS transporter [Hyphomicrobiales bacterium]|nr:MAG: MFS transporter [Hyphomicrobiales bacterium]